MARILVLLFFMLILGGGILVLCLPFAFLFRPKRGADGAKAEADGARREKLGDYESATRRAHYNAMVDYKYQHPTKK